MNENDNLMQMMRLVLEQVQSINERMDRMDQNIKHLPTREELLAVQQTAVTVEDKSETGYVLLNSQHNRLESKINELTEVMSEGFQTTANTLQEIFILNKSLVDKVNDLDDDVKDLQRKIG
jgi:hypothetical protein